MDEYSVVVHPAMTHVFPRKNTLFPSVVDNETTDERKPAVINVDAYPNVFVPPDAAPLRPSIDAIASLHRAAGNLAAQLVAGVRHRRTMKRIAGFSDHRLHDMGFERDWDGSVLPIRR